MYIAVEAERSWWIPAVYTTLGALIGFGIDRLKLWLDAKNIRKAFLAAVRGELASLREQLVELGRWIAEASGCVERHEAFPHEFAASFRTRVFDSQLSNLKNLSDPLLLDIVRLYSDLPVVSDGIAMLNERARQCFIDWETPRREILLARVITNSENLVAEMKSLSDRIEGLLPRLPR